MRNADYDLDNAINISQNFYAANTAIANLPTTEESLVEIRSDTENIHTLQRVTTTSGFTFQRVSTDSPEPTDGSSTFTATMESNGVSVSESVMVTVAGGTTRLHSVESRYFSINASSDSITLAGEMSFWAPAELGMDFPGAGYTFTLTPDNAAAAALSVTVAPDGRETIATGTAEETAVCRIRYLSSEYENHTNAIARIGLAAQWLDYSGSITWSKWVETGAPADGGAVDQVARDAAAAAQSTADTALSTANAKANLVHYATTPQATGQTFLGSGAVYEVVLDFGALPNATAKSVPHGVTASAWISIQATATNAAGETIPIPYAGAYLDGQYNVQLVVDATTVTITATNDMSGFTRCYVTLLYSV